MLHMYTWDKPSPPFVFATNQLKQIFLNVHVLIEWRIQKLSVEHAEEKCDDDHNNDNTDDSPYAYVDGVSLRFHGTWPWTQGVSEKISIKKKIIIRI